MQADLAAILEELRAREPIFHTPAFGSTPEEWKRALAPEYWEVAQAHSSWRRWPFVRRWTPRAPAGSPPTTPSVNSARRLLFTYTLHRGSRITRRATLWRRTGELWQILYHQGTVVSGE